MEKFIANSTSKSPFISLEKGMFQFRGRSIPEDATKIYNPVIGWLKFYKPEEREHTVVNFCFDYLDTSSSKCVFDILKTLDEIYEGGHDIEINWYYEEGDDDMLDLGIHLKSFVKAPFNFIESEPSIGQMDELIKGE